MPVAIKMLGKAKMGTSALNKFKGEVAMMRKVGAHPNIVGFFGAIWEAPRFWLVLELAAGERTGTGRWWYSELCRGAGIRHSALPSIAPGVGAFEEAVRAAAAARTSAARTPPRRRTREAAPAAAFFTAALLAPRGRGRPSRWWTRRPRSSGASWPPRARPRGARR